MDKVLFSSAKDVWATPQDLFDELNREFNFNLDPCALPENAKCEKYFTPAINGLLQCWGGGTLFFVTRRTVDKFMTGLRSATRKAKSLILQW